mgnify:CR=1 FL=1
MSWNKVPIKTICKGIYDGPHATPPESSSGAVFLGIPNFINGQLDLSNIRYISEQDLPKWTKRVTPQPNDIVFSYEATLNLYAIIPKGFWGCLGRRMALIRVDERKADYKFLYYYFYSTAWRSVIQEHTVTGATVDRIPLVSFPDFLVELPDLPTQRRIASILSAYDDLIENNRRQIKLLEEAAQRLYREWFVELRFPGHESVKVVDGVPEGWMKGTVDNIVKLLSGYPFKSSEYVSSGKYRLITIKNVKDGEFSPDNVDYIDQLPDKVPSHCILTEGDILLSLTGNIGRVCIVNGYNYLLNQRVAKLQTLHPAYAYCMFRSKEMLNKMTALSNGVAQQNLSPIRAEKIRILIPSSNLLFQFKNIVEPIISQIILLNNQITFACEARDRLLPELMDGEMEV